MCCLLPKDALDELFSQIKAHFSKVSPRGFTHQDPYGYTLGVNDFPIQVGEQTIFLEPMFHAFPSASENVLVVEVWTSVMGRLEEDDLQNLLERLEDPAFVERLVRKTSDWHSYSARPAEEIAILFKMWKETQKILLPENSELYLGGRLVLPEPLKSQALEYLAQRIKGWRIITFEDYRNDDSVK